MSLQDKLSEDLKQAMRDRDEERKIAFRLLRAAIVNTEVEVGHPLDDAEVQAVAAQQAKQRRDSIDAFRAAGRMDLVAHEEAQLKAIEGYRPAQMTRAEVEQAARETIAALGATGPAQMGAVMRELLPRLGDRADGKLVSQVVRELLAAR